MTDFRRLLEVLAEAGVEYVLVGGLAANAHGAIRTTRDVDIVYRREPANLTRLETALSPHRPVLRGAPPGLPFRLNRPTLQAGLNFTLATDLGELDLLGEIVGGGTYEDLIPHSRPLQVFGLEVNCLGLDSLIRAKRAAGRPKDFEVIAELEALRAGSEGAEPLG